MRKIILIQKFKGAKIREDESAIKINYTAENVICTHSGLYGNRQISEVINAHGVVFRKTKALGL